MRILHTADWHLGRVYHGVSLLEDQAHVLESAGRARAFGAPDVVLIAGDVYDRSVPPAEAVRLLDETLTRIVVGERTPVLLIAGNHDSPDRLGFGARLLAEAGLTVRGLATADVSPVLLRDPYGEVAFYPLPYAEPLGASVPGGRVDCGPPRGDEGSGRTHSTAPRSKSPFGAHRPRLRAGWDGERIRTPSVGWRDRSRRGGGIRGIPFRGARPSASPPEPGRWSHRLCRFALEIFFCRGRPRQERFAGRARRTGLRASRTPAAHSASGPAHPQRQPGRDSGWPTGDDPGRTTTSLPGSRTRVRSSMRWENCARPTPMRSPSSVRSLPERELGSKRAPITAKSGWTNSSRLSTAR